MITIISRDAEISYFDKEYKTITVNRNRYGRNKDFHRAIWTLMLSIFSTTSVNTIEVYYEQYKKSILFKKSDIIEGIYNISLLNHKRGYNYNE